LTEVTKLELLKRLMDTQKPQKVKKRKVSYLEDMENN